MWVKKALACLFEIHLSFYCVGKTTYLHLLRKCHKACEWKTSYEALFLLCTHTFTLAYAGSLSKHSPLKKRSYFQALHCLDNICKRTSGTGKPNTEDVSACHFWKFLSTFSKQRSVRPTWTVLALNGTPLKSWSSCTLTKQKVFSPHQREYRRRRGQNQEPNLNFWHCRSFFALIVLDTIW